MRNLFLRCFFVLSMCLISGQAYANTCAWVSGSTKNWSDTTAWTSCGGVAPTAADDVTVSGTGTLTVDGTSGSPNLARSVDFTGFTGTLTWGAAKQLNLGDGTAGAFKLVSGMTFTPNATAVLKFVSTTTGNNITSAGKTMPLLIFDGVGGAWQFQDNISCVSATNSITLTNTASSNGLDINGKTMTSCGLAASGTNTRSITMGAATWNLASSGTGWDITTSTNMTLSAGSSTISFGNLNGSSVTFHGGGLTYGTVSGNMQGSMTLTLSEANTFGTLTISANGALTGSTSGLVLAANQTVTGTFTSNGNSQTNRMFIRSDTKGTSRTITAATVSATYLDLQDITGAGAASWNLSAITGGSGNCGGLSGITTTTPITAYMKTAVNVNWSAANWYTASGGSTPISPQQFPLCQDTARFDANSVTATSVTITMDASTKRTGAMDWSSVANSPTFAIGQATSYFGSITLASGMTVSGTGAMTLEGRGSQTITTAGLTITPAITVSAVTGTWTLQDALTNSRSSTAFQFNSGTFAAGSNNITLTGSVGAISVQGGTFTGSGTISIQGTGGAAFNISSGTADLSAGTVSMTGAGSTTSLTGGTLKVGTLTRTGFSLTIAGADVYIGTGGAAYSSITVSSGSLNATSGNKITSVSGTAVSVSAAGGGGGSCSFGANDNFAPATNDNYPFWLRRAM